MLATPDQANPGQRALVIFVDWFLPGFKAGGQIQSCANLASALQHDINIFVITSDRDLGDTAPYSTIIPDTWMKIEEHISVMYLSPARQGLRFIKNLLETIRPASIYLNSMYSVPFTIMPLLVCRRLGFPVKIILSPRGMLNPGSLQFKKLKKQTFLLALKWTGFIKQVLFHATDPVEASAIKRVFGRHTPVALVNDYPPSHQPPLQSTFKETGSLRCLYVSRVSPVKNLLFLLEVLKEVRSNISLTIVGPLEDEDYWQQCRQAIGVLPPNVSVDVVGPVSNKALTPVYRDHHVFTLTTFGENFGHAIFESLLHGRPALISDQTPWNDLEVQNAGWVLPLTTPASFLEILESAAAWNQETFDAKCHAAWVYACNYLDRSALRQQYLALFN